MKIYWKKIVRIVLSLIVVVFACLQLNDPDPFGWIVLYGAIVVCGLFGSAKQNRLRTIMSVGYICLGIWLFPSSYSGLSEMSEAQPEIEQARESLGVLIAAGINIMNGWLHTLEWNDVEAKEKP